MASVAADRSFCIFFVDRSIPLLFQIPGITDTGLLPRKIRKVAILGGSLMSSGIATALVFANHYVIMKYMDQKSLENGIDGVKGEK